MYIVWVLGIGLSVGVISRLLIPGRDPESIASTVLLGIAGSTVASFIGRALGWYREAWEVSGFITSVVGAMLFILLYPIIGTVLRTHVLRR